MGVRGEQELHPRPKFHVSVYLNKLFPIVSATISELMIFQFNVLNVSEEIFKCLHVNVFLGI